MNSLNMNNDEFIVKNGVLKKVLINEEKIVLPDGIRVIEEMAFVSDGESNERKKINEIEFPSTLEIIEQSAFRYCDLKSIKLPEDLKKIGRIAFATNENLERVELYDNIEEIDSFAFSTKMRATNKLFKDHDYDKNHYIVDVPSLFIVNYTSYRKLDALLELLKKSGSFGSNTYKFDVLKNLNFKFILVGPMLSKNNRKKICLKLYSMKCGKVEFINNNGVEVPIIYVETKVFDANSGEEIKK